MLHHVKYPLSAARFSPDGKWISFLMAKGAGAVDAMLAPFRGESVIPEQDWITITTAPANISQVFWSPDGGLDLRSVDNYTIKDISVPEWFMPFAAKRQLLILSIEDRAKLVELRPIA